METKIGLDAPLWGDDDVFYIRKPLELRSYYIDVGAVIEETTTLTA